MLLKCDAAQLEWRVKVFLAQDKLAMKEIEENLDLHTDNQKVFGLPSRLIAKVFIYRMIFADAFGPNGYDGPAYAYANDPEFSQTSTSKKFWTGVIKRFFNKYPQVREHSLNLIREATTTGKITNPSGRFYPFEPYAKWDGNMDWPRTNILNYPVQGLAADFMTCARLDAYKRFHNDGLLGKVLFINTVHDSIELDCPNDKDLILKASTILEECFSRIPISFQRKYGVIVNVPMAGEISVGSNLSDTMSIKEYLDTQPEKMV